MVQLLVAMTHNNSDSVVRWKKQVGGHFQALGLILQDRGLATDSTEAKAAQKLKRGLELLTAELDATIGKDS